MWNPSISQTLVRRLSRIKSSCVSCPADEAWKTENFTKNFLINVSIIISRYQTNWRKEVCFCFCVLRMFICNCNNLSTMNIWLLFLSAAHIRNYWVRELRGGWIFMPITHQAAAASRNQILWSIFLLERLQTYPKDNH